MEEKGKLEITPNELSEEIHRRLLKVTRRY